MVVRWTLWLAERDHLGMAAESELVRLLFEIAGAGCQAVQVLGGRLARNESWG